MGRRLDSIYVVLVENSEGDEGIAAIPFGRRVEPLVASTEEKLEQIRSAAASLVASTRQTMRIVRFAQREHVENIVPAPVQNS